eukprot:GHVU01152738.1.p1 GENE.GHVU01152738.1~~GHVU01152738.1.p1  ORF type:complete len:545 (-),score=113.99 GHVU01152738.1:613-2247(-)
MVVPRHDGGGGDDERQTQKEEDVDLLSINLAKENEAGKPLRLPLHALQHVDDDDGGASDSPIHHHDHVVPRVLVSAPSSPTRASPKQSRVHLAGGHTLSSYTASKAAEPPKEGEEPHEGETREKGCREGEEHLKTAETKRAGGETIGPLAHHDTTIDHAAASAGFAIEVRAAEDEYAYHHHHAEAGTGRGGESIARIAALPVLQQIAKGAQTSPPAAAAAPGVSADDGTRRRRKKERTELQQQSPEAPELAEEPRPVAGAVLESSIDNQVPTREDIPRSRERRGVGVGAAGDDDGDNSRRRPPLVLPTKLLCNVAFEVMNYHGSNDDSKEEEDEEKEEGGHEENGDGGDDRRIRSTTGARQQQQQRGGGRGWLTDAPHASSALRRPPGVRRHHPPPPPPTMRAPQLRRNLDSMRPVHGLNDRTAAGVAAITTAATTMGPATTYPNAAPTTSSNRPGGGGLRNLPYRFEFAAHTTTAAFNYYSPDDAGIHLPVHNNDNAGLDDNNDEKEKDAKSKGWRQVFVMHAVRVTDVADFARFLHENRRCG